MNEFKRTDLRVGQIVAAEAIPGTSRLLKVEVDIGDEQRTLVAGVAQHYSPPQLLGMKVIVVANMEPATIRGVTSQGMMLGANCHDSQTLALLTVRDDIPNGTAVV